MTKKEHQEIINDIKERIEEQAHRTSNNIEFLCVDFCGSKTLNDLLTIVKDLSFCTTGIHPWRDTFDKMERMIEDIQDDIDDLKYQMATEVTDFIEEINI